MGALTLSEPAQSELQIPHWSLAARVVFRFCFVYLGLFCLTTQVVTSLFSPLQGEDIPDPATLWPIRQIVFWTAAHIFHIVGVLAWDSNSGSDDGTFDWVLTFCLLVFAVLATAIWSLLDGHRKSYSKLLSWFLLFIRFSLAGQMLNYRLAKAIPVQMAYPSLTRLIQPYGSFSPMGVLWSSIGASPAYEVFAGSAETLGGLLLIFPRTTTFGALICLVDMVQVFMLNMTYDVPVKLFALHLILLSLFLLTTDLQRLINVLFLNRATDPSTQTPLFRARRANRSALAAQILLGCWLIGINVYSARKDWYTYGGGRANSPLYGIWQVSQNSIDGKLRPLLVTEADGWRRVIFDSPTRMAFQSMDDSFARYNVSVDVKTKTLTLTTTDRKWKANFNFKRISNEQLTLDGEMDSHTMHMQLQRMNLDKFLLVSRGFHWIQEQPFSR